MEIELRTGEHMFVTRETKTNKVIGVLIYCVDEYSAERYREQFKDVYFYFR